MILYIALGVVVVALIVVTIFFLRKRKKEKAAAAAGGYQEAAPGGDEVSVLVHEAEGKLAGAKIPGAKVANLPAFILAGEAGSTKTTVMLNSGLDPELVAGQVYQGGNTVPTRSANFWFTRRAVFVEAGGALMADRGRWSRFVKRMHPKGSVVGKGEQAPRAVVVCYDSENFTRPGALDAASAAAQNLRARLGEMSQMMGINIPVYVLFTKADRLPFFTEYVRNLNSDEATQVVGVTLPMVQRRSEGVYAEEEGQRLTANFEQLFRSLADARPEFLSRENDATKLPSAYEFPREFRKIRPAVVQFLVDLCRPSQLTVGPFLRGYYFTGVRPIVINEAAPVAAPLSQQAASAGATSIFAMRAPVAAAAQAAPSGPVTGRKVPQWLFLTHFFNDVLMADKAAQGASGASIKVSGTRRWLLIAAASLCFLLFVFFTISFFNNRGLETDMRDAARGIPVTESTGVDLASLNALQKLDVLRERLDRIYGWRTAGRPFFYGWFLYIGDDLYDEGRKVYCQRFNQLLMRQTQEYMRIYLNTASVSNAEFGPTYEALRGYLITTTRPDKSDAQLPPVMMRFWTNDGNRIIDQERRRLAGLQFDFYRRDLLQQPACTGPADGMVIARTRSYLKNMGGAQRVYAALRQRANEKFKPIVFNDVYPGSERAVVDRYAVQGAFTKDGWRFMMEMLAHPEQYLKGEAWVLGDDGTGGIDTGRIAQDVKPLYVQEFINIWRTYLKSASVLKCSGPPDASAKLDLLSGPTSPILELFALASQNTDVGDPQVTKALGAVQKVVPPSSGDHVIGATNQSYMNGLLQLKNSVDTAKDQNPLSDTAAASIAGAAAQAKNSSTQIAYTFEAPQEIASQTSKSLLDAAVVNVESCCRAAPPSTELNAAGAGLCRAMSPLMNKYPFNTALNAPAATLEEINTFFNPKTGEIWKLVDEKLQKVVTRQGTSFTPKDIPGAKVNTTFIQFLQRAAAFADKAYAGGSDSPHFAYQVKLVESQDVDSATLTIDGRTEVFHNGQETKDFTWPSKGQQNANLTVKMKGGDNYPYGMPYRDIWSVFRFAYDAKDNHGTGGGTLVTRTLASQGQTTTDQATGKVVEPKFFFGADPPVFNRDYFKSLACVAKVAN
jgi:type VI secretion system protein ImpL